MSDMTFNRVEKKYILNKTQYENLKTYLDESITHDKDTLSFHESYSISNIYYDTEDNILIKKSVSKPKFKQKLRLRAYGNVSEDSVIFLELKKKINGYVNKRRTQIALSQVNDLIVNQELPHLEAYHNEQVLKEILYFAKQYKLEPSLYLYYEREVYSTEDRKGLRITFDRNITTRRYSVDLTKGHDGNHLLEDYYVLEIKTNQNMPYWLNQTLNELKIFSTSFSKYGTEFFYYLQTEESEVNSKCMNPYTECLK